MSDAFYTFTNLIGQEKAKKLLKKSIVHNRMGHAYLFHGPDGVGKKRTALTLAAFINCQDRTGGDPCGRCRSCRKFHSGNHPDLLIIQPDGALIKINQVRQLIQALAFPPLEAAVRVIILEDVHTMRREAANSLLKVLEEPPPDNLLILTADQAGDLQPTIISRCQLIPFAPLPYNEVAETLQDTMELDLETAATLATVTEGSLGRAERFQDTNLLTHRKQVIETLLTLQPLHPETPTIVFQLAEKTAALKEQLADLLDLLRLWLRDLMYLAAGGDDWRIINCDMTNLLAVARERWSLQELSDKLRFVNQAEKELLRNCNRSLVCEVLFLNLI